MSISSSTSWISVIRSSPYLSRISSSSCFITPTSFSRLDSSSWYQAIFFSSSLYSSWSFSRFRPCRAISRMSQMAWAWTSSRWKRFIRFSLALS